MKTTQITEQNNLNSDLFLEEREASLKTAQDEKRKIQISVPGMLNPHEVPEEMQEGM